MEEELNIRKVYNDELRKWQGKPLTSNQESLESYQEICCGCVLLSEENLREMHRYWEITELAKTFLRFATYLEGFDHMLDKLYEPVRRMIDDELYEGLDDEDKAVVNKSLYDDLRAACMLGENIAALYLAGYYENGHCGFSQDYTEAWRWYSEGANLHSASCYAALARMVIDDHTAPEQYDEAYGYECAYKALMLGGDTLDTVIQGYRQGFLNSHRAAIEQTYLPRYEQEMATQLQREQEIDDQYDDSHEYLADS